MTDLDPNSPANLRALILYDIAQRKTMRESIENHRFLCKNLEKKAISYDEYELCFNRCLNEIYHSTIENRDLPIADIQVCILSDVIDRKTAEKSIDDLCKAFKNHKINKEDHDYWYKRFHRGHVIQVTFSDFPEDVLAEIVGRCDMKSYLNLRNVSFGLRALIDQLAPPCTEIEVRCRARLEFGVYGALPADSICFKTPDSCLPIEEIEKRMPRSLTFLLRNPKLQLESFGVVKFAFQGFLSDTETVIRVMNTFNRTIHVKHCSIDVDSEKELIGMLQCFKPGTLEKIEFNHDFPLSNQIDEIDQWKQAKHLVLTGYKLPSIDHLSHFSTIETCFVPIHLEDLVKSIPIWTNFEHFKIEDEDTDPEEVKIALNLQPTASPEVYSIPNTNLFIQFERWDSTMLKIYKS
ncbi:hypothetical protein GCK72_017465 [Caenorhabditis remanei]|uniref:F-box domain-containing protein n=1 Tax=Caenorhabditis remanei TaxID=31234 RepID=A0A6A5G8J3_CAERE|nr:hypothetical protein GCK72_017465 [Caenorhabditis remanei]KAF1750914.1 hypothetical protein GCK72_017465 [Caenorhabditis remanei]